MKEAVTTPEALIDDRAATRADVMMLLDVNEAMASKVLRSIRQPTIDDIKALLVDVRRERHRRAGRCVYFVEAPTEALIKIGMTSHLEKRMRALRVGSPVQVHLMATVPGYAEEEALLHARFAEHRAHGEWFRASADLVAFIRGLPETFQ